MTLGSISLQNLSEIGQSAPDLLKI